MKALAFQQVSKSYSIYDSPGDRLKELLTLHRVQFHKDFWALRDVTFEVDRGEVLCVIGENGSGKSTLLQLVAGILQPAEGSIVVNGRVSALLELGAGFNPEFTGRDNVYLNGSILGFTTRQIDQRFQDIEEFAEIGQFINQPVKTYSSGMAVRLAFAVAIHVDPEILLVDEALAVGDLYFRQRCMRKVHELRSRGVTVLFVSHSVSDVQAIGDRVLWLERGRVREIGETDRVVAGYLASMARKDSDNLTKNHQSVARMRAPEIIHGIPNIDRRHGDGRAEVIGIAVLDANGWPVYLLESRSRIVVRISVRAREEVPRPIVGFLIRNHLGLDFSGANTAREGQELPALRAGEICTVDFHLDLPELYPGPFSFSPAVVDGTLEEHDVCDWIENALALEVARGELEIYGFVHLPCRVQVNARLEQKTDAIEHPERKLG